MLDGFYQTYINDAIVQYGTDELLKFWGQKVKVQGHSGIKYAESSSLMHGRDTQMYRLPLQYWTVTSGAVLCSSSCAYYMYRPTIKGDGQ